MLDPSFELVCLLSLSECRTTFAIGLLAPQSQNTTNGGDEIITLYDEAGNPVDFEFLDLIMLRGEKYVVLLGDTGESDEVTILHLEGEEEGDDLNYSGVEGENILSEVFEIFRQRNADRFNFEE